MVQSIDRQDSSELHSLPLLAGFNLASTSLTVPLRNPGPIAQIPSLLNMQQSIQVLTCAVISVAQLVESPEDGVQVCENFGLPRRAVADGGKDENQGSGGKNLKGFNVEASATVLGLKLG
jgi:hypothetical protein